MNAGAHESGKRGGAELSKSLHLDSEDVAGDDWQAQQREAGDVDRRVKGAGTDTYGVSRSCPPVQKVGGMGLARFGKDEYDKDVHI
jgi:hypothetical protein